MNLSGGQTLGRYEISGHLGAGGMGVVYRARDTQLGRDVAIKVLNEEAASLPSRVKRFEQEARAAARLSHPNILDIHDFGVHEGITYAVTELLHGATLGDRIRKSPLPLKKALEICADIAKGLAAAHEAGIIHRDIKPSNIFITDSGQVKILDFGVARLRERAADESDADSEVVTEGLTDAGKLVGTVGYMSPEQIEGGVIDARSDIFGLGCVMYEVLTNRRAFQGETAHDTVLAILGRDPRPITEFRPDVPNAVDRVVRRCLEKQPGERYESAQDVAYALQDLAPTGSGEQTVTPKPKPRVSLRTKLAVGAFVAAAAAVGAWVAIDALTPAPLPERLRIGVLPIEVDGDDDDLDVMAAGLTEMITEDLSIFEGLEGGIDWVVPPQALAGIDDRSITRMYRTFNVTVAIVGSLERTDGAVRITLTAVEPATGRRIRKSTIDHVPGNVASLQSEPILSIAEMLGIDVERTTRDRLIAGSTTMNSVLDSYIKGRGVRALAKDDGDLASAESLLVEAVQNDPLFCDGHIALARTRLGRYRATRENRWLSMALDDANRALNLDGCADRAWKTVGVLRREAGQFEQAAEAFTEAISSDSEDPEAIASRGMTHQRLKRFTEAEADFQRAVYLRPGYWPDHDRLGKLYLQNGMTVEAAVQFRQIVECAPGYALGYVKYGGVSTYLGETELAKRLFEQSLEIEPTYPALSNLGTLHFEASRFADAALMFERALELDATDNFVWGNLAYAYLFGPDPDRADAAFRTAAALAEEQLELDPANPWLQTRLAGYYAMLGETDRGLGLLEVVADSGTTEPELMASIADTYEDLGDRERALEWAERAFRAGIARDWFENSPTLRDLVADERYQALVTRDY